VRHSHESIDPGTGAPAGLIDFGDLALGDGARDFTYMHEDFGPDALADPHPDRP
jgi:hypothetical protein